MTDPLTLLMEPGALDDPHPTYAWLREHDPIAWSERGGVYVLSRHADIRQAFSNPLLRAPERDELLATVPRAERHPALATLLNTVPMTNPPVHTRLRKLVQRDFTARRVAGLRTATERICDALLEPIAAKLQDGEQVDIHEEFSKTLSMRVIADLLGVPDGDRPELATCVVRMLAVTNPASSEEALCDADKASEQVMAYFQHLVAERRVKPRSDLVSALVSTHADGTDQLTESELLTMVWALWASGFETSAAGIDTAITAMIEHPEYSGLLADGPENASAFAAEALRHQSPSVLTGVFRIAAEDLELSGTVIPAGSDVRMLPGSANRDPAAFPDADRFDPGRNLAHAVTFGHGVHHCLGVNLAMMEISLALPPLHARLPGLTLAGGEARRPSLTLRTYGRLPVVLNRRE